MKINVGQTVILEGKVMPHMAPEFPSEAEMAITISAQKFSVGDGWGYRTAIYCRASPTLAAGWYIMDWSRSSDRLDNELVARISYHSLEKYDGFRQYSPILVVSEEEDDYGPFFNFREVGHEESSVLYGDSTYTWNPGWMQSALVKKAKVTEGVMTADQAVEIQDLDFRLLLEELHWPENVKVRYLEVFLGVTTTV